MEKSLSLQIKLSQGPKAIGAESLSRVNEDIAGSGLGEKGTLAFLITLKSSEEKTDLTDLINETANSFEEKYLSSRQGTILKSLEEALTQVKSEIDREGDLDFEIISAVVWGPVLYVGRIGEGKIWLWRAGGAKAINFNFVASGMLGDGETVCLGNLAFESSTNAEQLSLILGRDSLEEVKKKLQEVQINVAGASCVLIRVDLKEATPPAEPISFVDTDVKPRVFQHSVGALVNSLAAKGKSLLDFLVEKAKPLLEKLRTAAAKAFVAVIEPWRKRVPGELHDEKKRKRTKIIQVGIVLGVLLVVSVSLSTIKAKDAAQKKQTEKILTQIKAKLEAARSSLATNPQSAASSLVEASNLFDRAKKEAIKNPDLARLEAELNQLLAENKHFYQATSLAVLAELDKDNLKADLISLVGDSLIGLDRGKSQLFTTELSKGKTTTLTTAIEGGQNLSGEVSLAHVTSKDSAWRFDAVSRSLTKVLSGETSWGLSGDIASYNGNLYVLDTAKGEVWKHVTSTAGLGSAHSYFTSDKPDLAGATSIAVDGSVWIGTKQGAIFQFLGGKKQEFRLRGAPEKLAINKIFTNADTNSLYLLDSAASRIVVFDKSGGYLASYEDQALKDSISFSVKEKEKTVYFSVGNKIYQFKIR